MKLAVILMAIASAVAQAATWDDQMFDGDRHRTAGRYAEAGAAYRAAMSAAADDRQRAVTANNLAALSQELGDRQEARKLYRQALDTWRRILPPDAPEIASTLNNLGSLYAVEGRYRDAAWYYQRALAIRPLPNTLNNLAEMYRAEGRYSQAEKIYRQLLGTLAADDPTLGTVLNNMGELCRQKGRQAEAREYYHRALAVWEKALGPDHPYKAATMHNLAQVDGGRKQDVAVSAFRERAR
jgi:tetratricopeptide (TPR) repeat protein